MCFNLFITQQCTIEAEIFNILKLCWEGTRGCSFFFFRTRHFCMLRSVNYIKIYLGDKLRYTLLYNLRTVKNICSSLKNTIHETKKGILDSKATTDWKGNTNCKLKVWNFQNNIAQFLSYASCRFFSSIPHKRSTYVFHFAANNFTVKSRGS